MYNKQKHTHIIGMIVDGEETRLVNIESLKRHERTQRELFELCNSNKVATFLGGHLDISFPFKTYTLQQYLNVDEQTDLYRFTFCPICGERIEWNCQTIQ